MRRRCAITVVLAPFAALPLAAPALAATTAARPLSNALRADGSLRPVHGSFSARGYRLVLGSNGAPRFIKTRAATRAGATRSAPATTATAAPLSTPSRATVANPATVTADANWSENFGVAGVPKASSVSAVAVSGPNIYIGGSFSTVSADAGVVYNNVAWWDGHGWRALGAGTNGPVNAIAVSATPATCR